MGEQSILNWIFGILMTLLGWLGKTLWDANSAMRKDMHSIERDLPKNYVRQDDFKLVIRDLKDEHRESMREIKDICDKIFNKLDEKADKS